MYTTWITAVVVCLFKASLIEGAVSGRFRRDTGRPHVEAIYSRYKNQSHGEATYYGIYPGGGACSLDPLSPLANQPGWIRVAAGREEFQNSLGCGMCVKITGSGKGKGSDPVTGTLKGVVHDLCGGCKQGDLDLYIVGDGRWDITIQAINCPTLPGSDGSIMTRFTGSNPWYIKLQARNTRIPVAGIEVLKNNKYSCLRRVSDNYFVGDGLGKVDFPMQVRLTSVNGEQRETIIPTMKNDVDVTTDIQFTGHETGEGPSTILCMGQGNKPPYPSGGIEITDPTSSVTSPGKPTIGVVRPPSPAPPVPNPPSPENKEFCKKRKGGTYVDPDRCSGFIICNIGNTHRMACGDGLLFNPVGMNCDLPSRVECGSRPLDLPAGKLTYNDEVISESWLSEKKNGTQMNDRNVNESKPQNGQDHHEQEDNHLKSLKPLHPGTKLTEMAKQDLVYSSKDKQGSTSRRPSLSDHTLDKEKANDSSSIHVGVRFEGVQKNEKNPDGPLRDLTSQPSEPMVHVTINNDRSIDASPSSSQSADETYKSKPSFEIMVNNDGVHARLNNNNGRKDGSLDSLGNGGGVVHLQGRFGGDQDPKPNFELMIRKNKNQVQNDKNETHKDVGHHILSKEDDNKNRTREDDLQKNTKENGVHVEGKEIQEDHGHRDGKILNGGVSDQSKEHSTNSGLVPLVSLNELMSSTKNQSNTDASSANTTAPLANITSKTEFTKWNQTSSQMSSQPKDTEVIKVHTVGSGKVGKQQPLQTTRDQSTKEASEPPHALAKVDLSLIHHEKSIDGGDVKPPHLVFNHPLEALTAYENHHQLVMDGKKKEESRNMDSEDSKKNEHKVEEISGNGKVEEKLQDNNATTQSNGDHEQQKRPMLDILVHGGSDGTTELRMRSNNNEIARHDDAESKGSGRHPVVGITIKQKDSPDHHILFSKRQKLVQHKYRQHHHNNHHH